MPTAELNNLADEITKFTGRFQEIVMPAIEKFPPLPKK